MRTIARTNDEMIDDFVSGGSMLCNPKGNIFREGDVLYSYGHHYPMAHRLPQYGVVLINAESSSVTTNAHRHDVYCAAHRVGSVLYVDNVRSSDMQELYAERLGYVESYFAERLCRSRRYSDMRKSALSWVLTQMIRSYEDDVVLSAKLAGMPAPQLRITLPTKVYNYLLGYIFVMGAPEGLQLGWFVNGGK